ncbi:MAG: DNA mismatch repair endonuclease MutL [bacterium]
MVLPKEIVDRIAAGEVVERPASALKELVENALDAEATAVTVTVDTDPVDLIEVADNGIGMTREELSLALERHATSKIRSEDDLDSIRTLGFRGEALPSIAAIADLEVETRPREAPLGIRACYRGGVEQSVQEAGMAAGTRMAVKALFRYTPARRKFLRSRQTEMAHVVDLFVRLALSRADVSFQLRKRRGELWLSAPATNDCRQRAAQLLGWELAERLYPVEDEQGPYRIRGLAGPPDLHKGTPQGLFLFVNHRPIRDLAIQRAIREAYQGSMPRERLPVAILFLSVPHPEVDVNMHPTKQEVRFAQPLRVRECVQKTLARLLARAPWQGSRQPLGFPSIPAFHRDDAPARPSFPSEGRAGPQAARAIPSAPSPAPRDPAPIYPTPTQGAAEPLPLIRESAGAEPRLSCCEPLDGAAVGRRPSLRLIGQYREAYLVCESAEGVVLVDQHAAHERLAYERLEEAFGAGGIPQQPLLTPVLVELAPQQAESLRDHLGRLAQWGMEIECYGGATFAVKALPSLIAGADPASLLRDVSDEILAAEKSRRLEDLRRELFARMACHAVVRAGQGLERREMEALLEQLSSRPELSVCPHGRPVRILFSLREIEKRFQRT